MTPTHAPIQVPTPRIVRILVAEDSPLNQQVALKQLERLGYQADAVSDGTQALEILGRVPYDIILMDCHMPEMSGYEATWQIRNREHQPGGFPGQKARLNIIAMTANTEADSRGKCVAAGMDGFINKPVQLPELDAAIHRALADRASHQAIEEVLDPVILAGLRQLRMPGQPDPLVPIIDLFLQEAVAQLAAMEQAILRNDTASLAQTTSAATALMGSAGNVGARSLAALCDEIVQTIRSCLLADALPILDKAGREFERVRRALEAVRAEATAGTPAGPAA
jgi:CheY-like chemotaxis protein